MNSIAINTYIRSYLRIFPYRFLECIADNPELPLDVAFELGRLAFERMHQGVTRSVNNGLTSVLFPEQALAKKKVPHTINIENKE